MPVPPTLPLIRRWADLLDTRFRIPGTTIRFGLDPLLSLVPGLGDLASPVFALVLIVHGLYLRVPRVVLVRMIGNAVIDACIGIVPIVGTVGDIFFRANVRNVALLERHARPGRPPSTGDHVFVFAAAAIFGMIVLVPVVLAIWLTMAIWQRWPGHPGFI